jgi:hypothetical protein
MESEGKVQLLAFLNTAMKNLCAPKQQVKNFLVRCVIISLLRWPYTMNLTFKRWISMPTASIDDPSLSGLAWTCNIHRPAYGRLSHLPPHFAEQYMVSWDDKV